MPEDIFDDIIISQLMEYMIAFIVAKDWIIGEALLGVQAGGNKDPILYLGFLSDVHFLLCMGT